MISNEEVGVKAVKSRKKERKKERKEKKTAGADTYPLLSPQAVPLGRLLGVGLQRLLVGGGRRHHLLGEVAGLL